MHHHNISGDGSFNYIVHFALMLELILIFPFKLFIIYYSILQYHLEIRKVIVAGVRFKIGMNLIFQFNLPQAKCKVISHYLHQEDQQEK
jgi:hypothetical protein